MFLHLRLIQISIKKEKRKKNTQSFFTQSPTYIIVDKLDVFLSIQNSWANSDHKQVLIIDLPKIQVLPREALATDHTWQVLQYLLTSEKYKRTHQSIACVNKYAYVCR